MNVPSSIVCIACQLLLRRIGNTPLDLPLLLLLFLSSQCIPLRHNTLLSPLTGCLGLVALGLHLLLQDTLTLLLGLGLVDL